MLLPYHPPSFVPEPRQHYRVGAGGARVPQAWDPGQMLMRVSWGFPAASMLRAPPALWVPLNSLKFSDIQVVPEVFLGFMLWQKNNSIFISLLSLNSHAQSEDRLWKIAWFLFLDTYPRKKTYWFPNRAHKHSGITSGSIWQPD